MCIHWGIHDKSTSPGAKQNNPSVPTLEEPLTVLNSLKTEYSCVYSLGADLLCLRQFFLMINFVLLSVELVGFSNPFALLTNFQIKRSRSLFSADT